MRSWGCIAGSSERRLQAANHHRANVARVIALVLVAASLGACAQSSVVSRKAALTAPTRQAAWEPREAIRQDIRREARQENKHEDRPASVVRVREPTRVAHAGGGAGHGLASFYSEGRETASGERFDPKELTAAHPSLPFGTRLQVTNVSTGKSVTVRVNDRGPFVRGRVVDVSYSAAQALGMVHAGVANVKVDVVE